LNIIFETRGMESVKDSSEDCFIDPTIHRSKTNSESQCSSKRSSNASLISQASLNRLIKEANEDPGTENNFSEEIIVISIHQDSQEHQLGIILTGGSDHENKDVTVYRILHGSLSDLDGRIQIGDRILSINGNVTKNLTLAKVVKLLKANREWIILVVARKRWEKQPKRWDIIKKSSNSPFNIYSSCLQTILDNSFGSKDVIRPSIVRKISRSKNLDHNILRSRDD